MLGKFMDNILFGNGGSTASQDAEYAKQLDSLMAEPSKLSLLDSDINPIDRDPLKFSYDYYPQEVGQLGDGHYMEFHVFTNARIKTESIDPKFNKNSTGGKTTANQIVGEIGEFTEQASEILRSGLNSKVIQDKNLSEIEKFQGYIEEKYGEAVVGLKNLFNSIAGPADTKEYAKLFSEGPRDKFDTTHKILKGSIVLYTPPENKFKYSAEYENSTTGVLGGLVGANNFMDALPSATVAGLGNVVSAAMDVISPGSSALLNRAFGVAINPNIEVAFKSVQPRTFNYSYKFAPKNEKELDSVHNIINTFKFHMHPALTVDEFFFLSPSQFQIQYMYRRDNNNYIPRISKCVLNDMTVDYSPNQKFTTLKPDGKGASPQIITMELTFTEMQIVTKETIVAGM